MEKQLAATNELVAETKKLIELGKKSYLAASANVYRLYESWTGSPDAWVEFYQEELDLSKSQVSKMKTVGEFLLANNLLKTTKVSYEKLYRAIASNRGEEPEKVLAIAETWGENDFRDEARESCLHQNEPIRVCPDCFKKV